MDFFDGRCYRISKKLLVLIGHWPFTPRARNIIMFAIFLMINGSQMVAKVAGGIYAVGDSDLIFESLGPIFVDINCVIKLTNNIVNVEMIKVLLRRIESDVKSLNINDEPIIMNTYAEKARTFTIVYTGAVLSAAVAFMILPIMPVIIGKVENGTDRPLIHNVKYFGDPQDHYVLVSLHSCVTIWSVVLSTAALDSVFVMIIQHACGLFKVVGYQLDSMSKDSSIENELWPSLADDRSYLSFFRCVHTHKLAIKFTNDMQNFYSGQLFLQAGFNMLSISLAILLVASSSGNMLEMARKLSFSTGAILHIYFECLQGQLLLNHSTELQQYLINTKWYQMSGRTRRGISFMMMRAQTPSSLNAAGRFTISMETFAMIMKTSMSYFTVLQSMQ